MEEVSLSESAFKWMSHCGNLDSLHKQCEQYMMDITEDKMKGNRVYRFFFTFDVGELMNFDAKLGNTICCSTKKASEIFQEACFVCIQTLQWIPQIVSKTQIALDIRYLSVPHFISCSSIFDLRSRVAENYGKHFPLFTTTGTICGMTSRSNYVQSTWYKCLNVACDIYENGFVQHYPNISCSQQSSLDLICRRCGTVLEEDISCRVLGEQCLLHVISSVGFTSNFDIENKKHRLHRAISVYVRDELINDVELGGCFSFSLIPFRELGPQQAATARVDFVFEVNNLVKIDYASLLSLQSIAAGIFFFNDFWKKFKTIYSLYQDRKTSSWSFTATLAYLFAETITPRGTYFRLKLALLLSIISQQAPSDTDDQTKSTSTGTLHLLIVSKDILHIQKLLLFSTPFVSPSVVFSPCNDLSYSLSKDSLGPGSCMINSGCLPLANDGVCVLKNLSELKGDQMNDLENVLQTQSVTVEIPRKYIASQQSQITIPIRCKIWACYETTKQRGMRAQHNACQIMQENGRLSKALLNNFSLVFNINDNATSLSSIFGDNLITQDILNKAIPREKKLMEAITETEFFEFFNYVSTIKASFTMKARELIQGFYLSSRRIRSSLGQSGCEFPLAALKTMMSLAEAHTKLSLRTEVSEDDATIAILLYEESITGRVGYSVLGLNPLHHFKDDNVLSYTGLENDERMTQLKIHIKRFCSLHSNYKYIPGEITHEE